MKRSLLPSVFVYRLPMYANAASSKQDLQERIEAARNVLDQIMDAEDNDSQKHSGAGDVRGRGARNDQGSIRVWRSIWAGSGNLPDRTRMERSCIFRMAGGSWGLQFGGQSTDLILVAVNDRGFQDLLKNKFKIGAMLQRRRVRWAVRVKPQRTGR